MPLRQAAQPGRTASDLALVALLYFAGAKLGMLTVLPEGMAVLWPANAVVLAAMLRFRGALPWSLLPTVLIAEVCADWPAFSVGEALMFGALNYSEAALAYALLARWGFDARFRSPADLWKFVLAGPLLASCAAALGGAAVYTLFRAGHGSYLQYAQTYWFSDGLGLLVITPLLLGFQPFRPVDDEAQPVAFTRRDALAWGAGAAVLALHWVFAGEGPRHIDLLPLLLIASVLYAAARYPQRWVAVAVLGASMILVGTLIWGGSPFALDHPRAGVWLTQEFILLASLLGLGFSALLRQVRARQRELEQLNAGLEARVATRTVELSRANDELSRLAAADPLTGVANRRRYEEALASEVARARRYGTPLSLVIADLDHFKRVNDTHGHSAGDEVIRAFTRVLQQCARASDLVARCGGEEFAVLMPHTSHADALAFAERARLAFAALRLPPVDWALTASFGVAELSLDLDSAAFAAAADEAMYAAKRGGRNRVVDHGILRVSLPLRAQAGVDCGE